MRMERKIEERREGGKKRERREKETRDTYDGDEICRLKERVYQHLKTGVKLVYILGMHIIWVIIKVRK